MILENALTRRRFLKTAALAAAGATALSCAGGGRPRVEPAGAGAADPAKTVGGASPGGSQPAAVAEWKARARERLKPAVFADVYAELPVEQAAERMAGEGFSSVFFFGLQFADVRLDVLRPDWAAAERIRGAFERRGIRIGALGGYHNPVHPDPIRRELGTSRMRALIANWKRLGSPIIATETGTFDAQSEWAESPRNATEEGYVRCRTAFEELAREAEKAGAIVAIEPYWRNVIDSVERTERLFREISSPALKLVMDPCNYFRREDLLRMQPLLREIFRRVGAQTVVAHAKDVRESADGTELPAAGKGVLDYPLYLELLAGLDRDLDLAVEHLTLDDVPRASAFVRAAMA